MMIWPLPGVPGSELLRALKDVEAGASNIYSHGSNAGSVVDAYVKWVSDSGQGLRRVITPADLRQLVLTEAYWMTLTMANPAAAPPLMRALYDEIAVRQQETRAAVEAVDSFLRSWSSLSEPRALVMADTNVLLHHEFQLEHIPWHELVRGKVRDEDVVCIVMPLLVIDELDDTKRDKMRSRARQALQTVYDHFETDTDATVALQARTATHGEVQMRLLVDNPGHIRLPRADDELVDRASALQSLLEQPVNFVTYDTGAAIRAAAAGLATQRLVQGN